MSGDVGLDRLNALDAAEAEAALRTCCGSRAWARAVARARPFRDRAALLASADRVWWSLGEHDWLEAFRAHPRIGERTAERWAAQEQAGARDAAAGVRARLAAGNRAYEMKFGHIFLICATGRSAAELLDALHARLSNDAATELRVAAEEQRRITHLRIGRLLDT